MILCFSHQAQQVEEQVCVFPDHVVRLTAQIHKVMEATGWFVSSVDDVGHIGGEDERGPVPEQVTQPTSGFYCSTHNESTDSSPFDVSEHLRVSEELPEVDVEHVAARLQHDVVVVPVTDSQDVGRHTTAGTRVDEVLHSLHTDTRCRQAREYSTGRTHTCVELCYLVVLLIGGVVFLQPVRQWSVFEGSSDSMFHLDFPQSVSVGNHLHHT